MSAMTDERKQTNRIYLASLSRLELIKTINNLNELRPWSGTVEIDPFRPSEMGWLLMMAMACAELYKRRKIAQDAK